LIDGDDIVGGLRISGSSYFSSSRFFNDVLRRSMMTCCGCIAQLVSQAYFAPIFSFGMTRLSSSPSISLSATVDLKAQIVLLLAPLWPNSLHAFLPSQGQRRMTSIGQAILGS